MAHWFRREEATEPPVLDQAFLARLGKHIGMAELRELLADGLIELSDRLDAVERHALAGDIDEVATLCHEIAGAAGHLGLTRLSVTAVEAVRGCRAGRDTPAGPIVAPLLAARAASLDAADRFCRAAGDDAAPPPADPAPD